MTRSGEEQAKIHRVVRERKLASSPLARLAWLLLGLFFVAVGALGVVLPGLPTTPFLILAASCFVRSSERLLNWLLSNRVFGPAIRDFQAGRGVPRRVKRLAISTMWVFVLFAVLVAIPSRLWIPKLVVLAAAVIGTLYLLKLPNSEDFAEEPPGGPGPGPESEPSGDDGSSPGPAQQGAVGSQRPSHDSRP